MYMNIYVNIHANIYVSHHFKNLRSYLVTASILEVVVSMTILQFSCTCTGLSCGRCRT